VFAKMLCEAGLMDQRDFNTYTELFNNMSNFMKKPTLLVHLDVSPEESFRRIQERSRGVETGITLDYLKALHAAYEEFITDISRVIPVIRIDWSKFRTAEEMAASIKAEYLLLTNVRNVSWDNDQSDSAVKA
jgi:deoxyadenosine kinase